MVRNPDRRRVLADAGLVVLAQEGARGLTHRAVDSGAGVPKGTTSNYFRTRAALVEGLMQRIGERLAPDPRVLAELGAREPSAELFGAYLRDIVARLSRHREITLALFELRLEAARHPELAAALGGAQRANFEADVAFNAAAGLPGGRSDIALFHYAIDGLMLDRLTAPIDPGTPTDDVVQAFVDRLLDAGPGVPGAGA